MNSNTGFRTQRTGLAWRLGGGFACLLLLMLASAAVALWQLRALGATMNGTLDRDVTTSQSAVKLQSQANGLGVDLRQAILSDSGEQVQGRLKSAQARRDELVKHVDALKARALDADTAQAAAAVVAALPPFLKTVDDAVAAVKSGDSDQARSTLTAAGHVAARRALEETLERMATVSAAHMDAARQAGDAMQSRAMLVLGLLMAAAAAGAGVIAWSVTRGVVNPVRQATALARRIAEGQLAPDVAHAHRDELGDLLDAMQAMQVSLRDIVAQVRRSAEGIQLASNEMASGNSDLSSRTEQAASNLQATAGSMEELSAAVNQSAASATQASQMAGGAAEVARRGGEAVARVVSTMNDINTSSKKIADIISVIDGIAFQTNILALNAAVEAARAGEQGRGFAVVASEVRNLAQRSAGAAREIKTLIDSSVERVETGTSLVSDAGVTMQEIVASVQRVADIIGQMSSGTAQQTSGISRVNGAVGALDRMTQQNSALVEQAAAAAQSMSEQANRLVDSVRVFALGDDASALRPTAAMLPR